MSNYQSAIKRINGAQSALEIERIEQGLCNVHALGFLTDSELMRLDIKMLDRINQLLKEVTA
jgi:hypothetical protein|tara:strand:- start:76 stop:261 length:186 start_codon:yes stop_codon:yes gene_type:complete